MSFSDIFKSSFLNNYSQAQVSEFNVLMAFVIAAVLGIYIFFFYRFRTRNVFYSKEFAISLVGVTIITAAIIVTIQQSIVVSLGMVGALSIVRFRTAIKNPMDLTFMFWAISSGIICGANLSVVALILAFVITVVILLLEFVPNNRQAKIIQISYKNDIELEKKVTEIVAMYCGKYIEKSRNSSPEQTDIILELRTKKGVELTQILSQTAGIYGCSLISYEGDR